MIKKFKFCNLHNLLTLFFIQGDIIHSIIWKSLIDIFKTILKENCMYTIKNFKVGQSTIYRPVENEFKIVFVYNTSVNEVTKASTKFPQFYFEFATMDMLQERESKDKQCSGDYLEVLAVNLILLNNLVLIHLDFFRYYWYTQQYLRCSAENYYERK
jgi:hypothetical protein